jgi:esterase/lipase
MVPDAPRRTPARRKTARRLVWVAAGAALLVLLGPRPRVENRWVEPEIGADVADWLAREEFGVPELKPGEAKSILWVDPAVRGRTPVALVYLHGFSADKHELEPVVSDLARQIGANTYFARLTGHGQDGEALAAATADDWLADAAEAVAVGERLGERTVIVASSTGATLALWAAVQPESVGRIDALVLVSPNLGLRDSRSEILLWPWGGLVARLLEGPERCFAPANETQARHWTTCYPTRALVPMMASVGVARSLDFSDVRAPTLVFYSERDEVVDPAATVRLLGEHATLRDVSDSGDPAHHTLAGDILSPGTTDRMRAEIATFLETAIR